MQKWSKLVIPLALTLSLCACGHHHSWKSATCTEPRTCTECGQTEGAALGHTWKNATCTEPQTCIVCGISEGAALGHTWKEATCTESKACTVCGVVEGAALGHTWKEATCKDPKTCTVCGASEGSPLGHAVKKWQVTKDSTCTEIGIKSGACAVCGELITADIAMKEHTPSEWIITNPATWQSKGTRVKKCTVCGKVLISESYTATPEEIEQQYKALCKTISYENLQRRPAEYKDSYIKLSGEVFQIISETKSKDYYSAYFIYLSGDLYLVYIDNYGSGTRILEGDNLTVWGQVGDLYTYETVRGDTKTVPSIFVEYYR